MLAFNPIASAAIAANSTAANLAAAASVATTVLVTNATLGLNKNLESSISVSATVGTATVTVNRQLTCSLSVTATATASNLDLNKNLASSVAAAVTVNPTVSASRPLDSQVSTTVTVSAPITVTVVMQSAVSATATIPATALSKGVNLAASLAAAVTTSGVMSNTGQAQASINVSASTNVTLGVQKNLVSSISATANATATGTGVIYSSVVCKSTIYALLDVDGNTEGSPGGLPVDGFSPSSSVVLAQHIESEPTATYTITADFDPLLETEITSVFFNDNPTNVLSYSIIGADLFITANTPADVYTQASTFMVNRKVVPQFNESINYNVRFNTLVKRDNDGRNFYSNKFYAEQNSICFLQDDGTGIIDLYEEITPGTTKKLKTVGRLDYTTGFVEVKNLMITSLYDLELFFFVESLDSIIPTKDYFTEQNNLLVQSKTITFPTGEQVEISQYEKQTDIVDLEIYVTARSYALASPLTTVETRTATYVLRIVPDYNLGKTAIKQLILEQEA